MVFPANVASIRFEVEGLDGVDYTLESWTGLESLHEIPEHIATIRSTDGSLKLEDFIHKKATLVIDCHEDDNDKVKTGARKITGLVRRVDVHADEENQFLYTFVFVSSMWKTTQCNNTRIFQEKKASDIISDILSRLNINFELKLSDSLPKLEFCVQFQEPDIDFISRLAEEFGFFFLIDQEKDKVVFSDNVSGLPQTKPMKNFAWDPGEGLHQPIPETVTALEYSQSSVIKKVAVKDYNYMTPEDALKKDTSGWQGKAFGVLYHVFARHTTGSEGEKQAMLQIEEKTSDEKILLLETTCRSAGAGMRFKLKDYPVEAYNREYVIREVKHYYEDHHYRNVLLCMPSDVRYRPPRKTPKPVIAGVHTGVVTGPGGEKVYTDDKNLGRVKVRMNWDLSDTSDEESSCWIRLMHTYAGNKWGVHFIPRVGDEVLIVFLDGDPDRPIVAGSVHNATNVPPLNLPDDKLQNVIVTPFGHKMIFEDKEGSEKIELFTQEQQNYFKLDHGSGGHQIELRTQQGKMDIYAKKDITTTTDANYKINVKDDSERNVGGNETIEISKNQDITVKKNRKLQIDSDSQRKIGGKETVNISRDQKISVGKDLTIHVGSSTKLDGKMNITIKGSGAGKISIEQSGASIQIDQMGNVSIKGTSVSIEAKTNLTLKGSIKSSLEASGITIVKGAIVKIN